MTTQNLLTKNSITFKTDIKDKIDGFQEAQQSVCLLFHSEFMKLVLKIIISLRLLSQNLNIFEKSLA